MRALRSALLLGLVGHPSSLLVFFAARAVVMASSFAPAAALAGSVMDTVCEREEAFLDMYMLVHSVLTNRSPPQIPGSW